jgi:hypothetical protein
VVHTELFTSQTTRTGKEEEGTKGAGGHGGRGQMTLRRAFPSSHLRCVTKGFPLFSLLAGFSGQLSEHITQRFRQTAVAPFVLSAYFSCPCGLTRKDLRMNHLVGPGICTVLSFFSS